MSTAPASTTNRFLRIRGWERHYENNRTREMKRMTWIPVSTRLDSDGYTALMEMANGAAYFGCWVAILEVASQCSPRGYLRKSDLTPHTEASLARLTRIDHRTLRGAIRALTRIKWLEEVDHPAPSTQAGCGAGAARVPSLEGRKEGKKEADAAAGLSPSGPPAAGTGHRKRTKQAHPLPPEALETLERIRSGINTQRERTVAMNGTPEPAESTPEAPERGYAVPPHVQPCPSPRPAWRVLRGPRPSE